MTYLRAQIWGGLLAAVTVIIVLAVSHSAPKPCKGALTVQFQPPLAGAGSYNFRFVGDASWNCAFEVQLGTQAEVKQAECPSSYQLQIRGTATQPAISGVLLGDAFHKLAVKVTKNGESIYDTVLEPEYLDVPRAEDSKEESFCGQSAFLKPKCVQGSSECYPFSVYCDGPEDCSEGKRCCAAPRLGLEFGANRTMECSSVSRCLSRIDSYVVCHEDKQCPKRLPRCIEDKQVSELFASPVKVCSTASTPEKSAPAVEKSAPEKSTAQPLSTASQSSAEE